MYDVGIFIISSVCLFYFAYSSKEGAKAGYFILSALLFSSITLAVSGLYWYIANMVLVILTGYFFRKNLNLKKYFEGNT